MVGLVLAVLVALGGCASVAAQNALPGDALYPIKTGIDEPIMLALSFTDKGKAAYESELAGRRLSEAEQLSVSASVSAAVYAQIQANFKTFADRTQERISALASADAQSASDLASNFETALRAHEKVLARLAARDPKHPGIGGLQQEVDQELSDTVKVRTNAETDLKKEDHSPDAKTAAEGKLGAAANVIDSVTKYIDDKKAALGADAVTKALAKLADAKDLMTQGQAKLTAGDYAQAFILGNAAIRTAQEARALVELQGQLNVDLHLDGRASPSYSPHPTPDTEGYRQSQSHMGGGRVDIEVGF